MTPAQRNAAFLADSFNRHREGSAKALQYRLSRAKSQVEKFTAALEKAKKDAADAAEVAALAAKLDEATKSADILNSQMGRLERQQDKQRAALAKLGIVPEDFLAPGSAAASAAVKAAAKKDPDFLRRREKRARAQLREEGRTDSETVKIDPLAWTPPMKSNALVRQIDHYMSWAVSRGYDAFREYYINSILSGVRTQTVNVTSNFLNLAYEHGVRKFTEAIFNETLLKLGLGSKKAARLGEFKYMLRAIRNLDIGKCFTRAWREGANFADTFLSVNEERAQGTTEKTSIKPAIGGVKGEVVRLPGRLLAAVDDTFKWVAGSMEAASRAYRDGVIRGLSGETLEAYIKAETENPASNSRRLGAIKAVEDTFQDQHKGKFLGKVLAAQNKIRDIPFIGVLVMPFTTTPLNLVVQGMKKGTPLGSLNVLWRAARHGLFSAGITGGEEYKGDEAMRDIAEQMLAWTAAALLWGAAYGDDDDDKKQFLVTGSFEGMSRQERQHLERLGVKPYTIKIGSMKFSYQRIDPFSTGTATIVDFIGALKLVSRWSVTVTY
jgi:hypothetical protein